MAQALLTEEAINQMMIGRGDYFTEESRKQLELLILLIIKEYEDNGYTQVDEVTIYLELGARLDAVLDALLGSGLFMAWSCVKERVKKIQTGIIYSKAVEVLNALRCEGVLYLIRDSEWGINNGAIGEPPLLSRMFNYSSAFYRSGYGDLCAHMSMVCNKRTRCIYGSGVAFNTWLASRATSVRDTFIGSNTNFVDTIYDWIRNLVCLLTDGEADYIASLPVNFGYMGRIPRSRSESLVGYSIRDSVSGDGSLWGAKFLNRGRDSEWREDVLTPPEELSVRDLAESNEAETNYESVLSEGELEAFEELVGAMAMAEQMLPVAENVVGDPMGVGHELGLITEEFNTKTHSSVKGGTANSVLVTRVKGDKGLTMGVMRARRIFITED